MTALEAENNKENLLSWLVAPCQTNCVMRRGLRQWIWKISRKCLIRTAIYNAVEVWTAYESIFFTPVSFNWKSLKAALVSTSFMKIECHLVHSAWIGSVQYKLIRFQSQPDRICRENKVWHHRNRRNSAAALWRNFYEVVSCIVGVHGKKTNEHGMWLCRYERTWHRIPGISVTFLKTVGTGDTGCAQHESPLQANLILRHVTATRRLHSTFGFP